MAINEKELRGIIEGAFSSDEKIIRIVELIKNTNNEEETIENLVRDIIKIETIRDANNEKGGLTIKEKKVLINEIRKLQAPLEDRWVYRYVVGFLGAGGILTAVFVFILALQDKNNIPDGLIALGASAVGALGGMLVPSTGKNDKAE